MHTEELARHEEHRDMLLQKGVYPYEYIDSWARLKKPNCPHNHNLQLAE